MRDDAGAVFRAFIDAVGLHGQAAATAAGLPTTDWYALSVLDLVGPLPAGDLALRTGLTTGAATRMIDRLERQGRVRRVPDPADRRRIRVERVTGSAADAEVDELVGPARAHLAAVLDGYDEAQLGVLFDFFERAAPAFREATGQIREHGVTRRRRSSAAQRIRDAAETPVPEPDALRSELDDLRGRRG